MCVMHARPAAAVPWSSWCMGWVSIAGERARFGELFIKRGLVSDIGGLWRLPQIVGPSKAAELLFTGDIIDALEAERIGLVSRVVPDDELMAAATELARKIAANPPIAMRYLKQGLRMSTFGDVEQLGAYVANSLAYLFTTDLSAGLQWVITMFAWRWAIEVLFRASKQVLEIEAPQHWCQESVEKLAPWVWSMQSVIMVW